MRLASLNKSNRLRRVLLGIPIGRQPNIMLVRATRIDCAINIVLTLGEKRKHPFVNEIVNEHNALLGRPYNLQQFNMRVEKLSVDKHLFGRGQRRPHDEINALFNILNPLFMVSKSPIHLGSESVVDDKTLKCVFT